MMDLEAILRGALTDATTRPVAADARPGPRHQARSRNWVEALADAFRDTFRAEPDVRVFSKHHRGNRATFGLNELLFDVCVCRVGMAPGPSGRPLEYVREALWQVESEFKEGNARAWLVDFGKLVLGCAPHKLFIGPLTRNPSVLLDVLAHPARTCGGSVHVALVSPPSTWGDTAPTLRLWRFADGAWGEEKPQEGPQVPDGLEDGREAFRPDDVRVLFVGESPPAGGTFFYKGDSRLLRHTAAAFGAARLWRNAEPLAAFIEEFQRRGFYLVDLSPSPLNHASPAERHRASRAGVPAL